MSVSTLATQRIAAIQDPIIPIVGKWIRENPGTINFGQGIVRYLPPETVRAAVMEFFADPLNHRYKPVEGIPALHEAIYVKLAQENDIANREAWSLFVTAGSNMGFLQTVLAITDPGDEIIILSPFYFNHEMAIRLANAVPVMVACDASYQPDVEAIARSITPRTRAVVTISPNNPSGVVYEPERLRAINALCAERGIYHISDEAYEYFVYGGQTHFSSASLDERGEHTISLFSLSKTYGMASWRIGYVLAPRHLQTALQKIQDTNLICAPVISQHAAIAALQAGQTFCQLHVAELARLRESVATYLDQHRDVLTRNEPYGAFYFLIEVQTTKSALTLCQQLIEQYKVAVIPGDTFGISGRCVFRIAYGALPQDELAEGLKRLVSGLRALARGDQLPPATGDKQHERPHHPRP